MKTYKDLTLENASFKQRLREEQLLVQRLTDELNAAQIKIEALEQQSALYKHSLRDQELQTPQQSVVKGKQEPEVHNGENVENTDECVEILDCTQAECVEILDCTDDESVVDVDNTYPEDDDVDPAEGLRDALASKTVGFDREHTLIVMYGVKDIGPSEFAIHSMHEAMMNAKENFTKIKKSKPAIQLCEAIGLNYTTKYRTMDDLKKLHYSRLMLMTDRDDKCAYIKALIIHFINTFWPELLRLPFLEQFVIPAVTARLENDVILFSKLAEFEIWKTATANHHEYKIVHNKALAACTIEEVKEYLQEIDLYRFEFKYEGDIDNTILSMHFSKQFEYKQAWLNKQMLLMKNNKIQELPEPLCGDTRQITYAEFFNSDLVPFYMTCKNRLPSVVDGLTPVQRKVLSAFFQRNSTTPITISEQGTAAGDRQKNTSLAQIIIQMAQNYVGSKNINLLEHDSPGLINWCGIHHMPNLDSASIQLSALARLIFHPDDDALLIYQLDTDQQSGPLFYVPIIPMILVNGYSCAGPYCLSQICQYDPRDLMQGIRFMLKKKMPPPMYPWCKNFTGLIKPKSDDSYTCYGKFCVLGENQIEISELPVGTWAIQYKENVLVPLTRQDNGLKPIIENIEEYRTSRKVRFVLTLVPGELERMRSSLYEVLQLTTVMPLNNMFCFDEYECIRKYETSLDILSAFYQTRLEFYKKRKDYQIAYLKKQINQIIDPVKRRRKLTELRVYLQYKTPEMLWIDDLNALEQKLDLIDKKESIHASADKEEQINDELKENTNDVIEIYIDGEKQNVVENPDDVIKDPLHEGVKLEIYRIRDEEEIADDIQEDMIIDPLYEVVKLEIDRLSDEQEHTYDIQENAIKNPHYEVVKLELYNFDEEVQAVMDIVDDPIYDIYGREQEQPEMDTEETSQEQCLIDIKEENVFCSPAKAELTPTPKRQKLNWMSL